MMLTVGAAARAAGVSAKAVRLWEAKGLLPPAERTDAGYRMFTDDDLDVLRFIRQAKTLGLTLPEIKDIINLQRAGTTPCGRVTDLLDTHIAEIDRAIAELRQLRRSLASARQTARDSQRRGQHVTVCRIIETAATATSVSPRQRAIH
jgi:DNA-binding transcriptional MerR regulator